MKFPTFQQWRVARVVGIAVTSCLTLLCRAAIRIARNAKCLSPFIASVPRISVYARSVFASTADLFRARINPKSNYAIGTAPIAPRNGFMLLSGRDNFPQQVKGPFTRLHLVDDVGANNPTTYAQQIGYRQWMRNGITFTGNSDQAYIGQEVRGG